MNIHKGVMALLNVVRKIRDRFFPPSKNFFNKKIGDINAQMERTNDQLKNIERRFEELQQSAAQLKSELASKLLSESAAQLSVEFIAQIKKEFNNQSRYIDRLSSKESEILWAQIFNNTISQSPWLKQNDFSPGRWAAGYPYLYLLYRVLDMTHPMSILEMGLGQTTKMISQFASYNNSSHDVVEHDEKWISFFMQEFSLPTQSNIIHLELTHRAFKNDSQIICYDKFKETFENRMYDFISIDGPYGTIDTTYSRIDLLDIIPGCLSKTFVIMLDDYNRKGEREMIEELKRVLSVAEIPYHCGIYQGEKNLCVIVSEDLKFLCTL
jgi:hypothetical protein